MFQIGDKVIRKSGKANVGIIIIIHGEEARVKWQNQTRRLNGNNDTNTWYKLDGLKAATEETVKTRQHNRQVKVLKEHIEFYASRIGSTNCPAHYPELVESLKAKLAKLEAE